MRHAHRRCCDFKDVSDSERVVIAEALRQEPLADISVDADYISQIETYRNVNRYVYLEYIGRPFADIVSAEGTGIKISLVNPDVTMECKLRRLKPWQGWPFHMMDEKAQNDLRDAYGIGLMINEPWPRSLPEPDDVRDLQRLVAGFNHQHGCQHLQIA